MLTSTQAIVVVVKAIEHTNDDFRLANPTIVQYMGTLAIHLTKQLKQATDGAKW